jgi:tetratricopeptide (TPR) repeat protein
MRWSGSPAGTSSSSAGPKPSAAPSAWSRAIPYARRATRALERGEHPAAATIAPHYEQAGATAEAVRWYERAAEAAQWLHAHADAVRALERALALSGDLPTGPDTARLQLRLLTALPAPLLACEGYASEQIGRVHARALQLAGQLGSQPEPPLVWSLAMAALCRGEWEPARGFAGRLRARAERDDDQVLWVESGYLQGIAAYWPARLTRARGYFEAAMERFRPERRRAHVLRYGQDPELLVRLRLAHTLWLLGDPEGADRQRDRALRVARESTRAYSRAVALVWLAGRRPDSRWLVRRSAWAAAPSCGRPRSGGCARRSWRSAALPRARPKPNSSARSRWPGGSRLARSRSESGKRSRNAPSATVVLSDDRTEEER